MTRVLIGWSLSDMTRELLGTIIIYGVTIVVTPLVVYQMGYELIQWIKKRRDIRKGHQKVDP